MKMRVFNQLTAVAIVIANILAFVAVLVGQHTTFGIVAVSISLAVSLGMWLRVLICTAALKISENQEEMMDIAIFQQYEPEVAIGFAKWIRNNDRHFMGALFADIAVQTDKDGNPDGYWLLAIGPRRAYNAILKAYADDHHVVLDRWPVDRNEWADRIIGSINTEVEEPTDDDAIPELKG